MKRLVLIFIYSILMSPLAFGQYVPKGKVSKADMALSAGKLDEAKAEIDLAFELDEKGKTTTSAKNWYTRGNIYKAIYTNDGEYKDLDPDALEKATASYKKTAEIEGKENGYYTIFANQEITSLYASAIDAGAVAYQEENFDKAFEEFSNALKVKKGDSLALLYAGSVAQEKGDIDNALKMYETMVEVGSAPETVYSTIVYYYKVEKDDMETAMKFNDLAIKKFPESKSFVQEKIVYLITSGKSAEAEQHLLSEIEAHPEDPILYFELGYLYDEQENDDKALEAYGKAFEVDPTYYDAIFNYAIVHYNKAADIIKAFNDKPLGSNYSATAYAKEEKQTMEKAAVHFKAALPYLEKAYELKSDDLKLLEILGGVYNQLRMDDKYDEISKKLEALESVE